VSRVAGTEKRLDDFREKLVDLLRRPPHEPLGIERGFHVCNRNAECGVGGQPVEQVVSRRTVLERARSGNAVLPNALVRLLPIAACPHGANDQFFIGRNDENTQTQLN